MTFIQRHTPRQVADLVFHDPHVQNVITDYASGSRDKHLLLYGPAGSGKSIAAQIIVNARLGALAGSAVANPINPRSFKHENFDCLLNDWSAQRIHGATRGYTVIDEVDWFKARMLETMRAFIDSTQLGTIIVTTNHLHKLDAPFKDRFFKLYVERPAATDWTTRAQAILAAEGVNLTAQQVSTLLSGFTGSARDLIDWVEDYSIKLKLNPLVVPTVAPAQPATVQTPFHTQSHKILVNGHSLQNKAGN